jgi:hypothetical protein
MSIHWPCYCTVHDYAVIHSCNSMWSLWVEANLCSFFIVCLSVLSLETKLSQGWGIPLPPLTCQMIVPFQFRNRISNAMCYGIFVLTITVLNFLFSYDSSSFLDTFPWSYPLWSTMIPITFRKEHPIKLQ